MEKTLIKNPRLNEQYKVIKHPSGLTICLYPMEGYSSTYALFATRYGSVDTTFKTNKETDYVTVPEGIAHYLEHKLFENDECDAFELYAKTGANANAYTSFDKTAYLFSCSQKFEENLEILLNFVQDPYFTDESVAKEQGIIGQEIKMYEDNPSWRVFFNGLQAVYQNNPVRVDIAGTVESIAKIDKELLYRCYETFYNLNNMILSIAGNFDVEKALEICDRLLKPSEVIGLDVVIPEEPRDVKQSEIVQKLSCSIPLFQINFKFPNFTNKENAINYIKYNILFEICLGTTSGFYNTAYKSGLINDTFSIGVLKGRGFFTVVAEGEANDPRKVFAEVKAALNQARDTGISEKEFENVKKKTYGELIMMFNSVNSVATNMMEAHFNDGTLFDMIEITAETAFEDIKQALASLEIDNSCISIIEPV